jgi:hypothetical protein
MVRFPIFEGLTHLVKAGDPKKEVGIMTSLSIGGFAGVCSSLFNNPLDTIKTRMQKQGYKDEGMAKLVRSMWKEGGIRVFYAGAWMRLIRIAPGQAITWAVVEEVSTLLRRLNERGTNRTPVYSDEDEEKKEEEEYLVQQVVDEE